MREWIHHSQQVEEYPKLSTADDGRVGVLCRIIWEVQIHTVQQHGAEFGDFYGHYYRRSQAHTLTVWGALISMLLYFASMPIGLLISNVFMWSVPFVRRAQFPDLGPAGELTFAEAHPKLINRGPLLFAAPFLLALLVAALVPFVT